MTAACRADPRHSQPQAWAQVTETCLQFLAVTQLWSSILPEGSAAPVLTFLTEEAEELYHLCIQTCALMPQSSLS